MSPAQTAARMTCTYQDAERMLRDGRLGYKTWLWYEFFWVWSAARFSNVSRASDRQDKAYSRLGADIYRRRMERVNNLRERLASVPAFTDVAVISEYGLTQKLSNAVRVF